MESPEQLKIAASIDAMASEGTAITYSLEAIKDIQGTIRAVDTKIGFLLTALVIPLNAAAARLAAWHQAGGGPGASLLYLATLCYFLAFIIAIATLSGIGSAHVHVEGTPEMNTFFAGGLYRFNLLDAVFRRKAVRSRLSLDQFSAQLPESHQAMKVQLASEIMTLAYIRDLKLLRQRYAFGFSAAALILAAAGFAL